MLWGIDNNFYCSWLPVPLMSAGAVLLLGEDHGHEHVHEVTEHEHGHRHDDSHHLHDHLPGHSRQTAGTARIAMSRRRIPICTRPTCTIANGTRAWHRIRSPGRYSWTGIPRLSPGLAAGS